MKKSFRLILFGVLSWFIPFAAAFAFYDSNGKLTTSYLVSVGLRYLQIPIFAFIVGRILQTRKEVPKLI